MKRAPWPTSPKLLDPPGNCRPARAPRSTAELFELFADGVGVALGLHPGPVVGDLAVGADDDRRADDADGLLAVEDLLTPGAVIRHRLVLGVGEQTHLELVLGDELLVALEAVRAAADDR